MGFAKWNLYEAERPETEWRRREEVNWSTGRSKEVAQNFLGATSDIREKTWGGIPHCYKPLLSFRMGVLGDVVDLKWLARVVCALLRVHRDCPRRGAGTLLVQWGLDHGESLGLPVYLEASVNGYPLYLKLGFHDIDVVVIKADKWDGSHDRHYIAMLKIADDVSSLTVKGNLVET